MIKSPFRYLFWVVSLCGFTAQLYPQPKGDNPGFRIAWDYSSLRQIAEKGGYPRAIKLQGDTLLAVYENYSGDVELKRSVDQGNTWTAPQKVFSRFVQTDSKGESTTVRISNPEIIQLPNQDLVLAVNYRPIKDEVAPFSIAIKRSTDHGHTWLDPQIVYTCAPRFRDGCWEPSFLWLPHQELQLYFANENPYQESDEQEISMIRSTDFGKTWTTEAQTVSFRKNRRDGMPVGILKDDEIIIAIEDNKVGEFKPYLVRTKLKDGWKHPVFANSSKRDYALKETQEDSVYMGAPYFIDLPNQGTLLSYQTTKGRGKDWERSTMEVVIGDRGARNFGFPTRPFPVSKTQEAKWNSLMVLDTNLVAALSSTNFQSNRVAPWMIKGHVIPNTIQISAKSPSPTVFVGSQSANNLTFQVKEINDQIRFLGELTQGKNPEQTPPDILLFLELENGKYKIIDDSSEKLHVFEEVGSTWKPIENSLLQRNIQKHKKKHLYVYELLDSANIDALKMGIGVRYAKNTQQFTEYLVHMDPDEVNTWIQVVR